MGAWRVEVRSSSEAVRPSPSEVKEAPCVADAELWWIGAIGRMVGEDGLHLIVHTGPGFDVQRAGADFFFCTDSTIRHRQLQSHTTQSSSSVKLYQYAMYGRFT